MTAERRESIDQYIQSRGEVRFKELEERYRSVSSMTLRRDLEFLERQGRIIRIRGGAKSLAQLSMIKEAAYTQRQAANTDAKMIIADKAVSLLSEGRSIYIDSGTTCMCFAQRIPDQNLFVLTPAPNIALELVKNANIRINLTGGQLNRETLTLSGFNATEYVKTLNIELAFIASSAFSLQNGFSCGDYFEAELKRLVIRKARQTVVLMDHSKLNSSMPYTFAKLQNLYALVCDQDLPEEYQKAAHQAHVLLV
ncbi:MAG: DeoR/GlpR transcriptional regulator [Clostridia bacterium]|nr:DeoR/GlpR transcriptional regulator [Clostridia bacterium]